MVTPYINITKWITELYRVPLYVILSEFDPSDLTGIGAFYDFFTHMWRSPSPNTKPTYKKKKDLASRELHNLYDVILFFI